MSSVVRNNKEIKNKLEEAGIVEKGDFTLKSGRKSKIYVNKDKIFINFELFAKVLDCLMLTIIFGPGTNSFDVIAAPEGGGCILASPLITTMKKNFVRIHEEGKFILKHPYKEFVKGKKVLLIDDVITTGGTLKQCADEIERAGGIITDVVCIWNRTGNVIVKGLNIYSLVLEEINE